MVRKQEFHRKGNQGGYHSQGPRNAQEQNPSRDGGYQRENNYERTGAQQRDNSQPREASQQRDGAQTRNSYRDNSYRQNYSNQSSQRHVTRTKSEETIDDIKADISRIEKEIDLEIKEIKSLRLGL